MTVIVILVSIVDFFAERSVKPFSFELHKLFGKGFHSLILRKIKLILDRLKFKLIRSTTNFNFPVYHKKIIVFLLAQYLDFLKDLTFLTYPVGYVAILSHRILLELKSENKIKGIWRQDFYIWINEIELYRVFSGTHNKLVFSSNFQDDTLLCFLCNVFRN